MTLRGVLCAIVLVFGAVGCGGAKVSLPSSDNVKAPRSRMHAGIAEVDITPPPGLALFGHGPEGRVATGFRLRLRCQAFVLASGKDVVALLPCDLSAPSHGLQRKVASRLRASGIPIGGDRLYLMATHTHAGPAHYFEPIRYSSSFSSYEPGYDEKVSDFLAERLAGAVARAYADLRPACVGWGHAKVYGLTRNRSYAPFTANPPGSLPAGLDDDLKRVTQYHPAEGKGLGDVPATFAEAAVDPRLSVLRIDEPNPTQPPEQDCKEPGGVRGAFVVFGMHPTAIPNTNDLYHGDVFGFASRDVETCLQAHGSNWKATDECQRVPNDGSSVVVGIAQGISGDVSPAYDYQGTREARRLGRLLAQKILEVHAEIGKPNRLHGNGRIAHVYRELRFPCAQVDGKNRLCINPSIGTAAAGGAEAGPTRFRIIPETNEGRRLLEPNGCHGYKLELIPPTGPSPDDGTDFPAIGPIALVGIDNGFVATAPVEMTTVTGRRIRDALEDELKDELEPKSVALTGLTNSYLQYVATREEYNYQHYEGASTLYGPHSAVFLRNQFRCLAEFFQGKGDTFCRLDQPNQINQLVEIPKKPEPLVSRLVDDDRGEARELRTVKVQCAPEEGADGWKIEWEGPGPGAMANRQRLEVQVFGKDGALVDDDRGSSIELRYDYEKASWSARWVPCLNPVRSSAGYAQQVFADEGNISFSFCRQGQPKGETTREYQIYVRSRIPVRSNWFTLEECRSGAAP